MRLRNDTGSVLAAFDLDGKALDIGPNEEFDSSLPVPGCTEIDPAVLPKRTPKTATDAEPGKEPAA